MSKKMRLFVVLVGVMIQIAAMLLYSFAEVRIPEYTYMAIWCACALIIRHSVKSARTI